jgi:hypothetical protein
MDALGRSSVLPSSPSPSPAMIEHELTRNPTVGVFPFHRAALYVAGIPRWARPAELPVQMP